MGFSPVLRIGVWDGVETRLLVGSVTSSVNTAIVTEKNKGIIHISKHILPADGHGDDDWLPAGVKDLSGGWDLPGYQHP